ncbi:hypothetical protein V6N13_080910 [Hibiscus sabdariffa]
MILAEIPVAQMYQQQEKSSELNINVPLKEAYPRIFAIASCKAGVIADFGSLVDGVWHWNISLPRSLFDWKKVVWDDFDSVIQGVMPGRFDNDSLRWVGNTNGFYK